MNVEGFSDRLERLVESVGCDEGFHLLALHSFVEGFIGWLHPDIRYTEFGRNRMSFYDKVQLLEDELHSDTPLSRADRQVFGTICAQHRPTNRVRHDFASVTTEEARSATHTFLRWCRIVGFDHPALGHLETYLERWSGKVSTLRREAEIEQLRGELSKLRRDYRAVEPQLAELDSLHFELAQAEEALEERDRRIKELETIGKNRGSRADALRRQIHELRTNHTTIREERDRLQARLDGLSDARAYLQYLSRYTAYTRSRSDYERSVMELSREQADVVERVRKTGDFLITGPAGTGKTLVLLHALNRNLDAIDNELGIHEERPITLLTYTRTLVRFNHYLNVVIGSHRTEPHLATVDAFLLERLKMLREDAYIVFPERLAATNEELISGLVDDDPAAVVREIEDTIYFGDLDRDGYLGISGAGSEVWAAAEALRKVLEADGGFTRNLACHELLRANDIDAGIDRRLVVRRIYVDEIQDLSPLDLRVLKRLAGEGLVMAGDRDQAIYRARLHFRDAGIAVQGRSRRLRFNYRNTIPVLSLADEYRCLVDRDHRDAIEEVLEAEEVVPVGVEREGPEPELYIEASYEEALAVVVRRVKFFLEHLDYDGENLAVLAPSKEDIKNLQREFRSAEIRTSNLRSSTFDFETTRGVRLSTMHSAKGVEFPVVFLFLPGFRERVELTREEDERIQRNLLYVAMTRAMDNLQVFVTESNQSESVNDLVALFHRADERKVSP